MFQYNKIDNKFCMSFTSCSLLLKESVKVAALYLEIGNWKETRRKAIDENLLQFKTHSAQIRTLSEIIQRLSCLDEAFIENLTTSDVEIQKQILWYAICLKYRFIFEFVSEVIDEKYSSMQLKLTELDYDSFYNAKIIAHEELDELTEQTRKKLKQVLFKMLKEVGILGEDYTIFSVRLNSSIRTFIENKTPEYLRIFPR